MRYIIDAWLEDGDPRLSIRDADTGAVRMQWTMRGHAMRQRMSVRPARRSRVCSGS